MEMACGVLQYSLGPAGFLHCVAPFVHCTWAFEYYTLILVFS